MYRPTRVKYWSQSKLSLKLREKFGLTNPEWMTLDGWDEHEAECKKKAPFIHWLTSRGFNMAQNYFYAIPDLWWACKTATVWKFLRNMWLFRKALWAYRSWDYTGLLLLMETAARDMSRCHKEHGHLARSEDTARELKIWADLLKRVREDEYRDDKVKFVPKEGSILGGNFEQIPNTLPKHGTKGFHKIVESNTKNDLELIGKMFSRKVRSWWD